MSDATALLALADKWETDAALDNRAFVDAHYYAEQLREAIAALAPPAEPSAARKDAERLIADCELGPNCNICRVLRALIDERITHAV